MRRLLGLYLLFGSVSVASAQSHPKVTRMDFMAGCWEGSLGKDDLVQENWTAPTDNMMLATTRYLNKDKQATGWEFTRIVLDSGGVAFIAAGNGNPEHRYALTTISKRIGHTITVTPNPCSHWGDSWHLTIDGELIAICSSEAEASDAASCWISLRSPTP